MKTYMIEIWNHILVDIEIMNGYIEFSFENSSGDEDEDETDIYQAYIDLYM